jgi:hypothetical protein
VIIGDIHGQFYDLAYMYEKLPQLPNASYLFLGDYIDRGLYSVEVLILLYSLKVFFINIIVNIDKLSKISDIIKRKS